MGTLTPADNQRRRVQTCLYPSESALFAGWPTSNELDYVCQELTRIVYIKAIASRSISIVTGDNPITHGVSLALCFSPSLPGRVLCCKGSNPSPAFLLLKETNRNTRFGHPHRQSRCWLQMHGAYEETYNEKF